jgi:hypothetical protein
VRKKELSSGSDEKKADISEVRYLASQYLADSSLSLVDGTIMISTDVTLISFLPDSRYPRVRFNW